MQQCGNDWPVGWDCHMKISGYFIHFFPLKKPLFSPVWHGPPSRWPPFEHSSTKLGSLDTDRVYSTLCPSITLTCSTSKFHLDMLRYSVSGLVMLDAFTYGKDWTLEQYSHQNGWGHLSFLFTPSSPHTVQFVPERLRSQPGLTSEES